MINFIADIINSILQAVMFVLIPAYCTEYRYKNSKKKNMFYIFLLWVLIQLTTVLMGNSSLGAIIMHLELLLFGLIIFKKDLLGALTASSIIYAFIGISLLVSSNLVWTILPKFVSSSIMDLFGMPLLYALQYLMSFFILFRRDIIYKLYLIIRSKSLSIISMIILTTIVDFLISFNVILHDKDNPLFKEIIFILLCIFIIGITLYFSGIEKKSKEIYLLNAELEENINELKKMKHDYGAQISYLYGLHLMGKYERIGELLKDIINGYNSIVPEVTISNNDESIISTIVNSISHDGINIVIDEQAPLSDTYISEMELQRILSNILRNSITAMKKQGTININTYYGYNNLILEIKNDGPKIDDLIIEKIFQPGFSTKKNENKENGFGLTIVKELVELKKGSISVKSTLDATTFTVKFPIRD